MSKKAFLKELRKLFKVQNFCKIFCNPNPKFKAHTPFFQHLWTEWNFDDFFFKTFDRWRSWANSDWHSFHDTHWYSFVLKVFLKKCIHVFFHNEMLLSKKGKKVHYFLYFRANKILMISVTRQLTYSICHCLLFCQFLKCLIWSSLPFVKLNQY